jgi:hypothetical protein
MKYDLTKINGGGGDHDQSAQRSVDNADTQGAFVRLLLWLQ